MSELSELLEKTKAAGDLRRSETLRLIEAAKKVSVAIVDAARDAEVTAAVPLSPWEEKWLVIVRDHEMWGLAVHEEYRKWSGKAFVLASGTEMSIWREIPPDNPHHLPAGVACQRGQWLYYYSGQENVFLTPAQVEEIPQWLLTLKRPLAKPSESLTRSQWVEVAGQLVSLAKKLAEAASARAAETTTAADLAERLKNAL